jgi:hypothetical protein
MAILIALAQEQWRQHERELVTCTSSTSLSSLPLPATDPMSRGNDQCVKVRDTSEQ